jgi:hypothetical protein
MQVQLAWACRGYHDRGLGREAAAGVAVLQYLGDSEGGEGPTPNIRWESVRRISASKAVDGRIVYICECR